MFDEVGELRPHTRPPYCGEKKLPISDTLNWKTRNNDDQRHQGIAARHARKEMRTASSRSKYCRVAPRCEMMPSTEPADARLHRRMRDAHIEARRTARRTGGDVVLPDVPASFGPPEIGQNENAGTRLGSGKLAGGPRTPC